MSKVRSNRAYATKLANEAAGQLDPLGWFEPFYAQMQADPARIPWADMEPNPNLTGWIDAQGSGLRDARVLVVGCGLGDDAYALAQSGARVVAFDISRTAVEMASRRFAGCGISFRTANLLELPPQFQAAFDLVVEIYTIQVLPAELREPAASALAWCVAPSGTLLVIARGRDDDEPFGELPWGLSKRELAVLNECGLHASTFEDYVDANTGSRRFRALYRRRAS